MYMTLLTSLLATPETRLVDLHAICVFDLETTGVDVEEDRIVTAYLGRINRRGEVTGSYAWLVNPGVPISDGAAAIHGISNEVAERDGQPAAEAIGEILAILRRSIAAGRPTVAYNASFDLSMLNAEAIRYGYEPLAYPIVLDPLVIDKGVDRYRKGSRKLVDTARHYGVPLSEEAAHDAQADAEATGRVAWAVLNKVGDMTLGELHNRQVIWARTQAAGLQAHFRKIKEDQTIVIDGTWPIRSSVPAVSDELEVAIHHAARVATLNA